VRTLQKQPSAAMMHAEALARRCGSDGKGTGIDVHRDHRPSGAPKVDLDSASLRDGADRPD
jgi:hypothetical protein